MSFTSRFQASGTKKFYGKKKRPISTSSDELQPHKRTSGDVTSQPADPRPAADRSQPATGSTAVSAPSRFKYWIDKFKKSVTPGKDSAGSGGSGKATPTSTTESGQPKGTPARKDKGPIAPRGVPVSGGSSKKPADDADGSVTPSPSAKEKSSQTPSAKSGDKSAQPSATLGAEDDDGSGGGSAVVLSKSKSVTPGKDSAAGALATPTPGEVPIYGGTPSTSAKESSKVASVQSGGGKNEGKSAPKAGKNGTGKETAKEDIGSDKDDAPTPAMVSAKSTPVGSPVEQSKGTPARKDSGGAPIAPRGVPVSGGSSKKPDSKMGGGVTPSTSAKEFPKVSNTKSGGAEDGGSSSAGPSKSKSATPAKDNGPSTSKDNYFLFEDLPSDSPLEGNIFWQAAKERRFAGHSKPYSPPSCSPLTPPAQGSRTPGRYSAKYESVPDGKNLMLPHQLQLLIIEIR